MCVCVCVCVCVCLSVCVCVSVNSPSPFPSPPLASPPPILCVCCEPSAPALHSRPHRIALVHPQHLLHEELEAHGEVDRAFRNELDPLHLRQTEPAAVTSQTMRAAHAPASHHRFCGHSAITDTQTHRQTERRRHRNTHRHRHRNRNRHRHRHRHRETRAHAHQPSSFRRRQC